MSTSAYLEFVPTVQRTSVVCFRFGEDFSKQDVKVSSIKDVDSNALDYLFQGEYLFVKLSSQANPGDTLKLFFDYTAPFLDSGENSLCTISAWYPKLQAKGKWNAKLKIDYPDDYQCLASGILKVPEQVEGYHSLVSEIINKREMNIGISYCRFKEKRTDSDVVIRSMLRGSNSYMIDKLYACIGFMEKIFGKCPVSEIALVEHARHNSSENGFITLNFDVSMNKNLNYLRNIEKICDIWFVNLKEKSDPENKMIKTLSTYAAMMFIHYDCEFNGISYESILDEYRAKFNQPYIDPDELNNFYGNGRTYNTFVTYTIRWNRVL